MSRLLHMTVKSLGVLLILLFMREPLAAQTGSFASHVLNDAGPTAAISFDTPPPIAPRTSAEILAAFVQAETQVRQAMNQHTFKRNVVLQTIGPGGEITGEYIRNSQFMFDDTGSRIEHVTYHPPSTIREMRITREDIQDLAGAQLLGIDIVESTKYHLDFVGHELLDTKQVYLIRVEPSSPPDPHQMSERFFRGRVWIDVESFQILKIEGVVEPQGKQRFPQFQTYRELVAPSLYLPTRTEADDTLHFPRRNVHYRIRVSYYDYKVFGSKLKVTEIDEPIN